ncbi:MAG: threo-3-hydroxy-L-aspartate ammonia-lyase [Pseudomonadota bacterium]
MTSLPISYDDVAAAHERVRGVVHRTPVVTSRSFDARCGARVFFKPENLQRAGAFKLRGAYNAIAQFTPAQRAAGVVTFSSGNHAQAIALAARLLGVKATVVMPEDAPIAKVEATRGYGAEVRRYDRYREDGDQLVRALAESTGMTMVPPFDHVHVMAGQGTLAKELFEDVGALDLLLTPVGGGGLLSGCATAARALHPGCRLLGVEPEAGNDAQRSLAAGQIVRIDTPKTIADAAQSRSLGRHTFPVLQALAEGIVTVSDDELVETMKFIAMRMKLLVEPTGCLAAAALLHGKLDVRGLRVGVVLSGGNVDLQRFAQLVGG